MNRSMIRNGETVTSQFHIHFDLWVIKRRDSTMNNEQVNRLAARGGSFTYGVRRAPKLYLHIHINTHRHTQTHKHRHTQTQTHTDTHRHTQTHTDTHIHTQTHTDTQRHTHSHTHTHTHAHATLVSCHSVVR